MLADFWPTLGKLFDEFQIFVGLIRAYSGLFGLIQAYSGLFGLIRGVSGFLLGLFRLIHGYYDEIKLPWLSIQQSASQQDQPVSQISEPVS